MTEEEMLKISTDEMRDRLLNLIKKGKIEFACTNRPVLDVEKYVVDYLLANGVISPKYKPGDKLWIIPSIDDCGHLVEEITEMTCIGYYVDSEHYILKLKEGENLYGVYMEKEEQIVFSSREEAEQALKGGAKE